MPHQSHPRPKPNNEFHYTCRQAMDDMIKLVLTYRLTAVLAERLRPAAFWAMTSTPVFFTAVVTGPSVSPYDTGFSSFASTVVTGHFKTSQSGSNQNRPL